MQNNSIYTVRFVSEDDIKGIHDVAVGNCDNPWSEEQFEKELQNELSLFLCAKHNNRVVGFINIHTVIPDAHINEIAVKKELRRQGIAAMLLNSGISESRNRGCEIMTLEVRSENMAARNLYMKNGFKDVGIRKRFYSNPDDDAVTMKRDI